MTMVKFWFDEAKPWLDRELYNDINKNKGPDVRKSAVFDEQVERSDAAGEFAVDKKKHGKFVELLEAGRGKEPSGSSFVTPAQLKEAAMAKEQIEGNLSFLRDGR